jgi:hypothetical protein
MVKRDWRVTNLRELRVISIRGTQIGRPTLMICIVCTETKQVWVISIRSTQIRKPQSNPWIVGTKAKQVAVVRVCPVSKDVFLPIPGLSRWLLFRRFNPLTPLLHFASMSLQFGGLIRNQIRYEAKDEIKSRTGRIRPLDGNLLRQQRKGIYQKIPPRRRNVCSDPKL